MATTKRKTDPADVLVNKLNVGLARHKKLLASWSSLNPGSGESANAQKNATIDDEEDFKDEALGYEQLGIGGRIPKDIQDGTFTRRTLTSNDKLLTQLMGKKAAKAHIAARQRPQAASSQSQGPGKPQNQKFVKPVESEDEEEGRSAAFKSKKKRKINPPVEEPSDGDEIVTETPDEVSKSAHTTASAPTEDSEAEDGAESKAKKAKTGSYLDQILAERSKKRKNKKKKAEAKTES